MATIFLVMRSMDAFSDGFIGSLAAAMTDNSEERFTLAVLRTVSFALM